MAAAATIHTAIRDSRGSSVFVYIAKVDCAYVYANVFARSAQHYSQCVRSRGRKWAKERSLTSQATVRKPNKSERDGERRRELKSKRSKFRAIEERARLGMQCRLLNGSKSLHSVVSMPYDPNSDWCLFMLQIQKTENGITQKMLKMVFLLQVAYNERN